MTMTATMLNCFADEYQRKMFADKYRKKRDNRNNNNNNQKSKNMYLLKGKYGRIFFAFIYVYSHTHHIHY